MTRPRLAAVAIVLLVAGCGRAPSPSAPPPPLVPDDPVDRSLTRAVEYLAARQDRDGAWRSDFYGPLKDGPSLTPLVVCALQTGTIWSPDYSEGRTAARKGLAYLAAMVRPDGTIDEGPRGLGQPVYTAALATVALWDGGADRYRPARDAWLKYLRERQLTEALGWDPSDRQYGGWGYCVVIPRKPAPGEGGPPLLESNLSATRFALAALQATKPPPDDPALKAAQVFVKRCQNYADDPDSGDPAFDDGGFFFIYDDSVRNKAGVAGRDRSGRERFASYGSATADGLTCLRSCSLKDDPRAGAARRWLESQFDASTHPGRYAEDCEASRDAVYYYYCRGLATALLSHGAETIDTAAGGVRWAEVLADELMRRQREDGSWANDLPAQRENDPLIATAEAVQALACCRLQMGNVPAK
jgi:hypothetical protein